MPKQFHGIDDQRVLRRRARRSRAARSAPQNAVWFVATTTASAPRDRLLERLRRRRDERVVDRDVGELALEQADELVGERVALVVGVGLERQAEHGDLLAAQRAAEAALDALDEEQRDALVDARDGEQHARGVRALLAEREVLAQAGAGGEARHLHPAARIVAVDEVDDLEDVRAVLLAVHHQEVGQRERRVAQDVRPDLRELGLDRRGLHDRRVEDVEQLGDDLAGALADAADDLRQRVDLLEEAAGGDALGRVGDEDVRRRSSKPRVLREVAGDELGRARRDRRAQDERVARARGPAAGRRAPTRMSRMSISMCENDGVPSVMTMCRARAASATRSVTSSRPDAWTRSMTSWPPFSSNGMRPVADGVEARRRRCRRRRRSARGRRTRARAAGRPGRGR